MTEANPVATPRRRCVGLIVLALSITLITGAVHGHLSQRWGPAPDLVAAAQQLTEFPQQVGDWQILTEEPMEKPIIKMLSCAGYVNRKYVNSKTGETVWLAIMLGPAGPIAVHTPEVCFSSRAYSIQAPREEIRFSDKDGKVHTFWSLNFRSNNASIDQLQVCYAWRGDKTWTASKSPRFEFGGRPLLYKLQLSALAPPQGAEKATDLCKDFLSDLLRSGWDTGS
jgi:hypothetical protein